LEGTVKKMLSKKKTEYFKKSLTEKLDELLEEANKTVSVMTDQRENYPDPTDRASLESDRNFELRIRDRERKLIRKIRDALERIEEGTFGICDECGEGISVKRLEARPVTTLCIDCKKKQENEEKLKGL
jgi:DnaK suppressor protein